MLHILYLMTRAATIIAHLDETGARSGPILHVQGSRFQNEVDQRVGRDLQSTLTILEESSIKGSENRRDNHSRQISAGTPLEFQAKLNKMLSQLDIIAEALEIDETVPWLVRKERKSKLNATETCFAAARCWCEWKFEDQRRLSVRRRRLGALFSPAHCHRIFDHTWTATECFGLGR